MAPIENPSLLIAASFNTILCGIEQWMSQEPWWKGSVVILPHFSSAQRRIKS
jgi:hypothetical protein